MLRRPYSEDDPGECLAHEARPANLQGFPACHYPHPSICPDHEVQCEICQHVILRADASIGVDRKASKRRGRPVSIVTCADAEDCADVVAARLRRGAVTLRTNGFEEREEN